MTVLPNAPIDAATGLPVPTIAVATDGGVSVIKDDGTVVDIGRLADCSLFEFYPKDLITSVYTGVAATVQIGYGTISRHLSIASFESVRYGRILHLGDNTPANSKYRTFSTSGTCLRTGWSYARQARF